MIRGSNVMLVGLVDTMAEAGIDVASLRGTELESVLPP